MTPDSSQALLAKDERERLLHEMDAAIATAFDNHELGGEFSVHAEAAYGVLAEHIQELQSANAALREALNIAEGALADIGDADREVTDDLAWCEQRAAEVLPSVRKVLTINRSDSGAATHPSESEGRVK